MEEGFIEIIKNYSLSTQEFIENLNWFLELLKKEQKKINLDKF